MIFGWLSFSVVLFFSFIGRRWMVIREGFSFCSYFLLLMASRFLWVFVFGLSFINFFFFFGC